MKLNAMYPIIPFDEGEPSSEHGSNTLTFPSRDDEIDYVDLHHMDEDTFDDMYM